jgi:hypothetical protein
MVTVALDAMGGDNGLDATVDGAAMLSREDNDIRVLLVGDVRAISDRLERLPYDPARLSLVAADGGVAMNEGAREAVREEGRRTRSSAPGTPARRSSPRPARSSACRASGAPRSRRSTRPSSATVHAAIPSRSCSTWAPPCA